MHSIRQRTRHAVITALLTSALSVTGLTVMAPQASAVPVGVSAEDIVKDCADAKLIYYPDPPADPNAPDHYPECRFTYRSSEQVWDDPVIPDALSDNSRPRPVARACGDSGGSVGVSGSKTSSMSFNFTLDLGTKRKFGDWEAAIGPKLGWSWSWSTTDTYQNSVTVPAWGVGWITVRRPLIKAVVDIAAEYSSNDVRRASKAVIYVPDKSRPYDWVLNSRPMSDWEISKFCGGGNGGDNVAYTESTSYRSSYGDFRIWLPSQYRTFNAHSGKCMSVRDGSKNNGAVLVQEACDLKVPALQRWTRTKQSDSSFLYQNDSTKKCADLSGDKASDWVSLQQQGCSANAAQQSWAIMRVTVKIPPYYDEQPAYYFFNKKSGKCMALDHDNLLSNNAPVQQYTCGDLPKPKNVVSYDIWSAGGNAPYKNLLSGRCMDLGGTIPGGGLVVQKSCNGKASQKWNAVKRNGGWHSILNNNGQCLTVPYNNGTPPGENTQLMWWGCETRWDSGNQLWSINPVSGNYTFSNQWTKLCLAPHSSDVTKDGGRVTIRRCVS